MCVSHASKLCHIFDKNCENQSKLTKNIGYTTKISFSLTPKILSLIFAEWILSEALKKVLLYLIMILSSSPSFQKSDPR